MINFNDEKKKKKDFTLKVTHLENDDANLNGEEAAPSPTNSKIFYPKERRYNENSYACK